MIQFMPPAIAQTKRLLETQSSTTYIRIGIKGNGCNGMSYVVEFYHEPPRERDVELDIDGAKVVIDKRSLALLDDTTVDYENTLTSNGFVFRNPREKSKCGCGRSFST